VVVEYQTPTGRTNKGVATTWLRTKVVEEGMEAEQLPRVPVYIRRSQFRLPNRPQTPVVMIGPGTGLAPFRGFIQVTAFFEKEREKLFC
jgi:NADPH-ferrihemoprotein reductase